MTNYELTGRLLVVNCNLMRHWS